jgi:PadR family transcriptional regulator, regulatory protein AphA
MSLPHALLGMISFGPATGYELKASFKKSIHYFWNATLPQIYRTLNRLESDGLLASSIQHQEGKPSRKVYELTGRGRAEFLRWLAEPPDLPQPKQPMLMKVFFGNQLPAGGLERLLLGWREYYTGLLRKYDAEVDPVIQGYGSGSGVSEDVRYWKFTLEFGKRHARTVIEWCDYVLKELERSGVPEGRGAGNDAGVLPRIK